MDALRKPAPPSPPVSGLFRGTPRRPTERVKETALGRSGSAVTQNGERTLRKFVAIVVGLSGLEFYLAGERETSDPRQADRFVSEEAAASALRKHIQSFPSCIARQLDHRVEVTA
jgi:hypothetical protein